MARVVKDKYDILGEVVAALRDYNKKVVIETLNARDNGWAMEFEKTPQIPTRRTKHTYNGVSSLSRMHAESIKIGDSISIKRKRHKPTFYKTEKNEYEIDNGHYYVVRTPKGEAIFESNDSDFLTVWNYALAMYDGTENYGSFYSELRNEKLKHIAGGPAVLKDESIDKFNKAVAKLKSMGIEPRKLADYIKVKTDRNVK